MRLVHRRLARRGADPGRQAVRRGLRPLARAVSARPSPSARPRTGSSATPPRSAADKNRASSLRREAESQLELLTEANNLRAGRLLQLPLLRQRGLPARLQLPAAAAVGLHPGAAVAAVAGRVRLAAPVPGDHRVRAPVDHLPRGLALPDQPGDPAGPGGRPARRPSRPSSARPAATSTLSPTASGRTVRAVRGAARPARWHRCSGSRTSRPSGARRSTRDEEERRRLGYEVQTGVRFAEHGGRPSCRTATVECGRRGTGHSDLRPGGDPLADQPGREPAQESGPATGSCSTSSGATGRGANRPATTRTSPTR